MMAAEAAMLQTPARATEGLTIQSPATSSSTPRSDDDTISNDSFDAGSDRFAFTPKRPAKLPRAWERKPATPFAPRTEAQKIWKRVPLQDKSSNSAVEIRANGKHEDDARGTKRVRLTAPNAVNGKESYANTQWDKQSDDAKRKVPKEHRNVLQSTRNSLSPLRRDNTIDILNDPPLPTALELEAEHVIRRLEEMQQAEEATKNVISSDGESPDTKAINDELLRDEKRLSELKGESKEQHTPETPRSNENREEQALISEAPVSEDGAATTPSTNEFFTDSVIFDDQESESEIDEDPATEDITQGKLNSDPAPEATIERSQRVRTSLDASVTCSTEDKETLEQFRANSDQPSNRLREHTSQSQIVDTEEEDVAETGTITPVQTAPDLTLQRTEDMFPVLHGYETVPHLMDTTEDLSNENQINPQSISELPSQTGSEAMFFDSEGNKLSVETALTSETSFTHKEFPSEAVIDLQMPPEAILNQAPVPNTTNSDIIIFGQTSENLSNNLFTPQAPTLSTPEAPPSDDTAYLHDFLTRARAQKAARAANSPEKIDPTASSPAKNTRQALANLSANPVSPSESAQTELKPDEVADDEVNENQATSPCRRSSRPRLPKPLKSVVPAIQNNIPVRRSNGTEFVFMQRTEAMQIALVTRTNTKRNKGEALPPNARLESLASIEVSPTKDRKKSSKAKKAVRWDEKLTQEQIEAVLEDQAVTAEADAETKPEPRPKPEEKAAIEAEKSEKREKKKVKRLGTVNGTPAPKRVTTALPVPTRTLRARTKA